MNKFGVSGIIGRSNNELFNILIWNTRLHCEAIINNGAYQPETKDNARKLIAAINDYVAEANKKGL